MTTNCRLKEVLTLNVHQDGLIYPGRTSGHFYPGAEGTLVHINHTAEAPRRGVLVPQETLIFLNFYLENRSHRHPVLFIRGGGKKLTTGLSTTLAKKALVEIFQKSGINIAASQVVETLQNTVYESYRGGTAEAFMNRY